MLKLCSNGALLRNLFSLHHVRRVLYSTSSPIEAPNYTPIVDYLVKSLGFSRNEAITASKKVSPSKLKSSRKPDLIVDILKQCSFNDTQIKKIVSSYPNFLWFDVGETLEPKLNALQELGIKGSDLTRVVTMNPRILRRGVNTRIIPMITYLKSILGSTKELVRVLGKSYWLIDVDVATIVRPNMEQFRNIGLSDERIRKMLLSNANIFGQDPKFVKELILRVEGELGIPRDSFVFTNGLIFLASTSEKNRQVKYQLLKGFGWTESDILTMVKKLPMCFTLSETILSQRLNYFMSELGCGPAYIASRPYILVYSTEARVVP